MVKSFLKGWMGQTSSTFAGQSNSSSERGVNFKSHKPSGTASCGSSSEDLLEEPGRQNCSAADKQSSKVAYKHGTV